MEEGDLEDIDEDVERDKVSKLSLMRTISMSMELYIFHSLLAT